MLYVNYISLKRRMSRWVKNFPGPHAVLSFLICIVWKSMGGGEGLTEQHLMALLPAINLQGARA